MLILSLDSSNLGTRTATIDFLLVITSLDYPKGHKLVLSALEYFCTKHGKPKMFDGLVESISTIVNTRGIFGTKVGAGNATEGSIFNSGKLFNPQEIREFLVSAVALVRLVVEMPPEFEYRMYIRRQLISSGITPVFEVF